MYFLKMIFHRGLIDSAFCLGCSLPDRLKAGVELNMEVREGCRLRAVSVPSPCRGRVAERLTLPPLTRENFLPVKVGALPN